MSLMRAAHGNLCLCIATGADVGFGLLTLRLTIAMRRALRLLSRSTSPRCAVESRSLGQCVARS
jgi:hypothetical protein